MPPDENALPVRPVSSADRIMDAQEESIPALLTSIVEHIQEIIRSEARLARVEVSEEASRAIRSATLLAAGAVTALYAILFLLLGGTALLALVMPFWGASMLAGFILLAGGAILFFAGRSRWRQFSPVPKQTVDSVKENVEWVRKRMK